jgi:hypothetical protein
LLREGWDGERIEIKNGFPKSPAGGFWFLQANASRRRERGKERDGNNAPHVGFYFILFCSQYSTWVALSGR